MGLGLYFLIFGAILAVIGGAFLAITHSVEVTESRRGQTCTVSAEAKLIDSIRHSTHYMDEIRVTYHGVYTYRTEDGTQIHSENKHGYGRPDDIPGPVATILYDPNEVTEFIIPEEQVSIPDAFPGLRRTGKILLALSVPLLIAAVVFWGA